MREKPGAGTGLGAPLLTLTSVLCAGLLLTVYQRLADRAGLQSHGDSVVQQLEGRPPSGLAAPAVPAAPLPCPLPSPPPAAPHMDCQLDVENSPLARRCHLLRNVCLDQASGDVVGLVVLLAHMRFLQAGAARRLGDAHPRPLCADHSCSRARAPPQGLVCLASAQCNSACQSSWSQASFPPPPPPVRRRLRAGFSLTRPAPSPPSHPASFLRAPLQVTLLPHLLLWTARRSG
jgi:hypothetical protein